VTGPFDFFALRRHRATVLHPPRDVYDPAAAFAANLVIGERRMTDEIESIDDAYPHREIAAFIAEGFANGDPVVVISTPESRRGIEDHLESMGIRPAALDCEGRARWFDSHGVLSRIVVGGLPDKTAFDRVMNGILLDPVAQVPAQRIRAYHDLVDVLRDRGSLDAAVLLLRSWNDLCSRYDDLLLAYTVAELYREKDCAV
jgi:hypothetical protein